MNSLTDKPAEQALQSWERLVIMRFVTRWIQRWKSLPVEYQFLYTALPACVVVMGLYCWAGAYLDRRCAQGIVSACYVERTDVKHMTTKQLRMKRALGDAYRGQR